MNDDDVTHTIARLEQSIAADDPAFVHRVHQVARRDDVHAVVVFVLLAIGAVLLTVGFATTALVPWASGMVALVLAVVDDYAYHRHLRRAR